MDERDDKINDLRRAMGTMPDMDVPLVTRFYEGVRGITVNLYDTSENPYKAMFNMVTSTWGKHINKWDEVSPENRFIVIRSLLEFKALPSAMEYPTFCFGIEGCSRSAFDQIARARIGAVFACLYSGNHLVETDKGKKKLKDICVGDKVLTHLGRYRSVTQTFQAYGTERYEIHFKGYGRKITSTAEHPFLIQHEGLLSWRKASDLKLGDEVVVLSGGVCEICGKPLPIKNTSSQKMRERFCSHSCQRKWWMTTEEAANINAWYKKIQDPRRMTRPEKLVAGILKYLNQIPQYGYRIQTLDKRFCFIDFAFPEYKIGIEVHGFKNSHIRGLENPFDWETNELRSKRLNEIGWKIIDIDVDDLDNNIDEVIHNLEENLRSCCLLQNDEHQFKFVTVPVKSIDHRFGVKRKHYNIEVDEDNSYIASGIVMHNSQGWRDNDHSDIGFRIPQAIYDSHNLLKYIEAVEQCKKVYHELVQSGQANWQDARAVLPISACHMFSMSINYMALRGFCNKRLKFCEQADTVAVAWLMRERVKEKFPLLGSYLRPSCDGRGVCEYHHIHYLKRLVVFLVRVVAMLIKTLTVTLLLTVRAPMRRPWPNN
jgi:thymidylate synthase ThyX/very-short-patch-repair endonuclease